jgi:hypothetical protein
MFHPARSLHQNLTIRRVTFEMGCPRRKIRLIEGNAKCCHLKKLTCNGALRQVFICLSPGTPNPPPPPTHCIRVYRIIIHTRKGGRGGRVEPERRLEGQQVTKLGGKYQHALLYLESINSDTGQFLDDDISLRCLNR